MTRNKDLKRIIRKRMTKTGESYTASRAHVISQPHLKQPPARLVDHAALAGMRDDTIAAKTGRTWREWTRVLDLDGAAARPHRDIAALVHQKHHVDAWWAQTVTVGYERIKGLRDQGQRRSGAYEVSKTRTFNVPVKTLFRAWADDATRHRWLDDVKSAVRTATAPKSMRLQWPDGTIVAVWFIAKRDDRSAVTLAHTKLPNKTASEQAKKYWTDHLDALGAFFARRVA
jgi:hypothetical protein